MKKLLLIALVASGLAFVPVQRSDAQIFIGLPGIVGIGIGPAPYYGYPYYGHGYYHPYGYYYRPYYGYYGGPYYWSHGHRVNYHHHNYYHHHWGDQGHQGDQNEQ